MRRGIKLAVLALGLLTAGLALAQNPGPLRRIGEFRISTGLHIGGIEFGGISGLERDPATGRYLALSDDRAERGPVRLYEMDIGIDARGIAKLEILRTIELTDEAGKPFPRLATDPEAIRIAPNGNLVWASEGDQQGRPALFEADRNGRALRRFALPDYYMPDPGKTRGVVGNLAHEGLAFSPDGRRLYALTENALAQDGPVANRQEGSLSRLLVLDFASGQPLAEYAYRTEPVRLASTRNPPVEDNGVSEILMMPDGQLIVVERTFALGAGNMIHLFRVRPEGGTNVLGRASLKEGEPVIPLAKELLMTLREGDFGLDLDNIEALALGPMLDGRQTLVFASDNNFNRNGQVTQFVVFALEPR
ncbi:esterase-like activity of phytase family protein [Rhabdaerophilum sp. SD176]|uniref:esterase-like activity of phytase family protein n=1 Tax=Rhabdaerophilum sp. SD176 TaxID=2983548 RepID=UPI0024DF4B73|nr:esterase-like activity of phytase family protein [Rhabdaerophilum sp. SD176]